MTSSSLRMFSLSDIASTSSLTVEYDEDDTLQSDQSFYLYEG